MPANRRHIPKPVKELVVNMSQHPQMTPAKIRELTGVSERTQYRLAALYRDRGEVVRQPVVVGRPRKLDALGAAVSHILTELRV